MDTKLVKEAQKLKDPVAAEKLAAKAGVEFHPIVCDAVSQDTGGCKHVSRAQRESRVAAYERAVAKAS